MQIQATAFPSDMVIAVAGPVHKGSARLTNRGWSILAESLVRHFACPHVRLLNDLTAVGYAMPHLRAEQLGEISAGAARRSDQRQSLEVGIGTGFNVANASPEAAEGGGLALSKTGDRVRFDLGKGTADILVPWDELTERARQLVSEGGYQMPASQIPWQQYFRDLTTGLDKGMTLRDASSYRDVARKSRPRDSH